MEYPLLAACDACYSRKIRCDRRDPCANCKDSRAYCCRNRQKQARKSRGGVDLEQAIQEIKATVSNVESTVGHLLAGSPKKSHRETRAVSNGPLAATPGSNADSSGRYYTEPPSKKRKITSAFGPENSGVPVDRTYLAPASTPKEQQYSPRLFSASEAQVLIQEELSNGASLNETKRSVFQAALSSLHQSLNRSQNDADDDSQIFRHQDLQQLLDNPLIPPASLVYVLLQSEGTHSFSIPDNLPIVSKETILKMSRRLLDSANPQDEIPSLICINSLISYFLYERVTENMKTLGPGDPLRKEIDTYFDTARAAILQMSILTPPTLVNLQALTFGALNAQEYGDIEQAWRLNCAAGTICFALDLHKKRNAFTGENSEKAFEAYACFGIFYMNDKGLAMNLGHPPSLEDKYIEQGVLERTIQIKRQPTLFYHYIELAQVQSRIITDLHSAARSTLPNINRAVDEILGMLDDLWQSVQKLRKTLSLIGSKMDNETEFTIYYFAFHSVKTVLLHSGGEKSRNARRAEACVNSARASLREVQHLREIGKESHLGIDGFATLGNWTILYYPFTPFFVVFCNVISNGNQEDHMLMQAFVDFLSDAKELSPALAKLKKLCLPFLNLATNMVNFTEEIGPPVNNTHAGDPACTGNFHSQDDHLETGKLPAIPPPPPAPSFPDQSSTIQDSVTQEDDFPTGIIQASQTYGQVPQDEFFWQLMDTQPRLQWLDSDVSVFEQAWGGGGFDRDESFLA